MEAKIHKTDRQTQNKLNRQTDRQTETQKRNKTILAKTSFKIVVRCIFGY